MIQNFFIIIEYSSYDWLSYDVTILSCSILYYKTYKTLKKYEKDFAKELIRLSELDRELVLKKSKVASQVFASYNKFI